MVKGRTIKKVIEAIKKNDGAGNTSNGFFIIRIIIMQSENIYL